MQHRFKPTVWWAWAVVYFTLWLAVWLGSCTVIDGSSTAEVGPGIVSGVIFGLGAGLKTRHARQRKRHQQLGS